MPVFSTPFMAERAMTREIPSLGLGSPLTSQLPIGPLDKPCRP